MRDLCFSRRIGGRVLLRLVLTSNTRSSCRSLSLVVPPGPSPPPLTLTHVVEVAVPLRFSSSLEPGREVESLESELATLPSAKSNTLSIAARVSTRQLLETSSRRG